MKRSRIGLYILSLAALLCLFVPCSTFAQDESGPPCCYNSPMPSLDLPQMDEQADVWLSQNPKTLPSTQASSATPVIMERRLPAVGREE